MNTSHDTPADTSPTNRSGTLVLVRHTESEWNLLGKWTGRTDVHLTDTGKAQAAKVGALLSDIEFHHAYTSEQIRTLETFLGLIGPAGGDADMRKDRAAALNERDYGDYTGMNKWEVLEQLGEDTFTGIRRGWDHPIPNGETLQQVHQRAVPFFKEHILPHLLQGRNILIVSHGNTLRALIKHLEGISDTGIAEVEMGFGQILLYQVDADGRHTAKETRQADIRPPKA